MHSQIIILAALLAGFPLCGQSTYSSSYTGSSEYAPPETCLAPITITAAALSDPVATTKTIALTTAPAGWSPRLVQVEETATFTTSSTRVTAIAASVGTLQYPAYYLNPLPLMKPAPNYAGDDAGGQAAQLGQHVVYLSVAVTNKNPGPLALTGGALAVKVCGVVLRAALNLAPALPTVGTLVGGVCQANSTGFHVVGKTLVSNEVQANCILQ